MIVKDSPEIQYAFRSNIIAEDALTFISKLETLNPNATVGFLSGKLEATRGVWMRIGNYRIQNGSFIDPSDLMLYVESYYEPDTEGQIEAIELNHGDAPEGALSAYTLDELLDALVQLDYCEDEPSEDAAEEDQTGIDEAKDSTPDEKPLEENADSAPLQDDAEIDTPSQDDVQPEESEDDIQPDEPSAMPSRLEGLTALEPSAASEMRGSLVKGWHAMYYEATDGSSLLVFD